MAILVKLIFNTTMALDCSGAMPPYQAPVGCIRYRQVCICDNNGCEWVVACLD